MKLSKSQKQAVQTHLQEMVENMDAAVGAIAVTADGHLVCRAEKNEIPAQRLAAMGSSLMSLGNTITKELAMGNCRNVISENEKGVVVFMQIVPGLVLVAVANDTGALGMLLSGCRNVISAIDRDDILK